MILTCPACATRYLVDPAALGAAGRTVRCARCAATWHQDPPADQPLPVLPLAGEAVAAESPPRVNVAPADYRPQLPALATPPRRIGPVEAGWIALGLFLVILGAGFVLLRPEIIAVWPATARLYAMIGEPLTQADFGLEIRHVTSTRGTSADGKPLLLIGGEVANVSGEPAPVPRLEVVLRNPANRALRRIEVTVSQPQLAVGKSVPFIASIADPPDGAVSAAVTVSQP